jgi:transposase
VHDIQGARALLAVVTAPGCLIGDKAYDANDVRAHLAAHGSTAVISPMPTRRTSVPFDPETYKARNIIERAFNRLKDWRAIATRYDKKASNFLAGVCLAAAVTYWLH